MLPNKSPENHPARFLLCKRISDSLVVQQLKEHFDICVVVVLILMFCAEKPRFCLSRVVTFARNRRLFLLLKQVESGRRRAI